MPFPISNFYANNRDLLRLDCSLCELTIFAHGQIKGRRIMVPRPEDSTAFLEVYVCQECSGSTVLGPIAYHVLQRQLAEKLARVTRDGDTYCTKELAERYAAKDSNAKDGDA